jgi:hypothetical protein
MTFGISRSYGATIVTVVVVLGFVGTLVGVAPAGIVTRWKTPECALRSDVAIALFPRLKKISI